MVQQGIADPDSLTSFTTTCGKVRAHAHASQHVCMEGECCCVGWCCHVCMLCVTDCAQQLRMQLDVLSAQMLEGAARAAFPHAHHGMQHVLATED